MASLMRVVARKSCQVLKSNTATKTIQPACLISTNKKKDSAAAAQNVVAGSRAEESEEDENWISYGYSLTDREEDTWAHNLLMFSGITIGLCMTGFYFAYMPDFKLAHWAQREAFLELARREQAGLPLISRDLIDPSVVELPSDEELHDTDIII